MNDRRKEIGWVGEEIAARSLQEKGYHLIVRNWTTNLGELDIIARDGGTLVFIEVRTTTGTQFGYGYESVTLRKQQQVRRLALQYIGRHQRDDIPIRFDVISILLDRDGRTVKKMDHFEGVF